MSVEVSLGCHTRYYRLGSLHTDSMEAGKSKIKVSGEDCLPGWQTCPSHMSSHGGESEHWCLLLLLIRLHAKLLQSCLTLCHSMDCSLQGSSVHRILQVRILEWVAMASPWPPLGDFPYPGIEPTSLILLYRQAGSLPPPGKFINATTNNKNHRSPTLVTSSDPNYLL